MFNFTPEQLKELELTDEAIKRVIYGRPYSNLIREKIVALKQLSKVLTHPILLAEVERLVKEAREQEQERIFKAVESVGRLFVGETPVEDKCYVYLGCYITEFGKTDEATMAFIPLADTDQWQALKTGESKR